MALRRSRRSCEIILGLLLGPSSNGRTPVFGTGGGGSTPPGPIGRRGGHAALAVALLAAAGPAAWGSPLAAAPSARPTVAAAAGRHGSTAQQAGKDSSAARSRSRSLQSRFERLKTRRLPLALGGSPECDEVIGRLCVWFGEGSDRTPKPEAEEVTAARSRLLDDLAEVALEIPGDEWVFGQRMRYLVEAGRLERAESLARRCDPPERWRCDAFLGYALHRGGDAVGAEEAYARALEAMPASTRAAWSDPELLLDPGLRGWLKGQPDSVAAVEELWTLADPLFVAEGNDRRTAHYSRWVYSMGSEDARNPFAIPWGDDMTEVVVRYGWPAGWERLWPEGGIHPRPLRVRGMDLPGEFRAFPPRSVLERDPAEDEPVAWELVEDGPAPSLHRPEYLDTLGALAGQVGRLWRPDGVLVLGAWRVPGSEVRRAAVRSGLFVVQGGAMALAERADAEPGGTIRVAGRAPHAGWGVLSIESWAPEARRAWRLRQGMGFRRNPPDVFALSDLFLTEPGGEPGDMDELLGALRSSTVAAGDATIGVTFEVYGLRPVGDLLHYRAWVERRSEGLLTRLGRLLGIGRREKVSVSWREAVPAGTGVHLRSLAMRLPGLSPGAYRIVIEVFADGGHPLRTRRHFTVESTR